MDTIGHGKRNLQTCINQYNQHCLTSRAAEDETRPAGDARAAEDARPGTGRHGRGRTHSQGRRRWRGRDDEVRVGAGRCRVGAASGQRGGRGRGRRRRRRGRGRDEGGGGTSDARRSEEGRSEGRRGRISVFGGRVARLVPAGLISRH